MKTMINWSVIDYMQKKEQKEVPNQAVAIFDTDNPMQRIQIDYKNGEIIIYKTGFVDDRIQVITEGLNKIIIR